MNKFTSGLLWGAFFGGLAGLMNAPQKGSETRKDLKVWIERTTDDVNDVRYKVDNLMVSIQRLNQEGINSANEVSKDLQETVRHFQEETEPRLRRVQDRVETLQSDIESISKDQSNDDTASETPSKKE